MSKLFLSAIAFGVIGTAILNTAWATDPGTKCSLTAGQTCTVGMADGKRANQCSGPKEKCTGSGEQCMSNSPVTGVCVWWSDTNEKCKRPNGMTSCGDRIKGECKWNPASDGGKGACQLNGTKQGECQVETCLG